MKREKIRIGLILGCMSALLICGSLAVGQTRSRYVSSASAPFGYIITADSAETIGDIIIKEEQTASEDVTKENSDTVNDSHETIAVTGSEESDIPKTDEESGNTSEPVEPKITDPTLIPEFMTDFFGDGPLALKLDKSRGALKLKFMSGGEVAKPLTDVRYSIDRGKTWYKLENISEFTLKDMSTDGYIIFDFNATGEISENVIRIYAEDGSGNMCEIEAEKKDGLCIEYDANLPWLIDASGSGTADKTVTGYNISNCEMTKKLEYMEKTDSGYGFKTVDGEALKGLIKSEVSTDGEAFRDTFNVTDLESGQTAVVPPGQYRMTYTWNFGDITVYETVIPFFINYSMK
ncbi:MAG: hypothetical protein HFE30_01290 [Clostridiales bacterium]|nr:hypothetical protein [Clostridiales bacterium]